MRQKECTTDLKFADLIFRLPPMPLQPYNFTPLPSTTSSNQEE